MRAEVYKYFVKRKGPDPVVGISEVTPGDVQKDGYLRSTRFMVICSLDNRCVTMLIEDPDRLRGRYYVDEEDKIGQEIDLFNSMEISGNGILDLESRTRKRAVRIKLRDETEIEQEVRYFENR